MEQIKKWLSRWQNLGLNDSLIKKTVGEAINSYTGLRVPAEKIRLIHRTIYLDVKPIWKTEVFLKQREILAAISQKTGRRSPRRIR